MSSKYNLRKRLSLAASLILGLNASTYSHANVSSEFIYFIDPNGKDYTSYSGVRSSDTSRNVLFQKDQGLDHYYYIYPNEYQWDTKGDTKYNLLKFRQGDYALMSAAPLGNTLTIGEDGIYTYDSGNTPGPSGRFGFWNMPGNFKQFAFAWVLPSNFEIVDYKANRKGQWVKRHNTVVFFAKNTNDIQLKIRYRPVSNVAYDALRKKLKENKNVKLEQQSQGVRVTLSNTVLFESGNAELKESGKSVLMDAAGVINKLGKVKIIVEGHTDNTPITGELKEKFKTNWELSAARAFTVLHYLTQNGVDENRCEVGAFGSQSPRSDNSTAKGRAENRRIELRVVPVK